MSEFEGAPARERAANVTGVRRVIILVAVVLGALLPLVNAGTSKADAPAFVDAAGIHVVNSTQIDARQYNVSVLSPALGRAVDVRILLPTSYAQDTTTHYPVLYLFHGTSGRASDWVNSGDAVATTAPYNLITVMPDAGFNGDGGSWFTNWVDTATQKGPSQWETFHVSQL